MKKKKKVLFLTDSAEKDFVGATLVQVLHKLLTEEKSAPEIKYNSMILICSVMGSGERRLYCGYESAFQLMLICNKCSLNVFNSVIFMVFTLKYIIQYFMN